MKRLVLSIALVGLMWGCMPEPSTYREQYIDTRCNLTTKKVFEELQEYFITHDYEIVAFDPVRGYLEANSLFYYFNYLHNSAQPWGSTNTIFPDGYQRYGNWKIISRENKLIAICRGMGVESSSTGLGSVKIKSLFFSDSTAKIPTFDFYWKTRNEIQRICGTIEFKDRP